MLSIFLTFFFGAAAKSFEPSEHWGQISPYHKSNFGISPDGLPAGCSYKQIHVLQRHGDRLPTSSAMDAGIMVNFASKIQQLKKSPDFWASGALEFLPSWDYILGNATLTAKGASTCATRGAYFWSKYGRLLYKTPHEFRFNASSIANYVKPIFRTTTQARMYESARWYISGFFANTNANSSSELYDLVIIPEGSTENNTLAASDSCPSLRLGEKSSTLGEIGNRDRDVFVQRYTQRALKHIKKLLPEEFNLTSSDVFAMQNLCAYETAAIGQSDFCGLFSKQDWLDYDYALGLMMYGNYAYGNPTGRAQGLGYVQELIARLERHTIRVSSSSVNVTFDGWERNFGHLTPPQPVYFDATHDAVMISVMTSLGFQFFNNTKGHMPANLKRAPKHPSFVLSQLTPFGANLHTEVISCPHNVSFDWTLATFERQLYTSYVQPEPVPEDNVDYIRMKLNEGVLPLADDLGCNNDGSSAGFCTLSEFLRVTQHVERDAQYEEVCYGNKVLQVKTQVANGNLDYVKNLSSSA